MWILWISWISIISRTPKLHLSVSSMHLRQLFGIIRPKYNIKPKIRQRFSAENRIIVIFRAENKNENEIRSASSCNGHYFALFRGIW